MVAAVLEGVVEVETASQAKKGRGKGRGAAADSKSAGKKMELPSEAEIELGPASESSQLVKPPSRRSRSKRAAAVNTKEDSGVGNPDCAESELTSDGISEMKEILVPEVASEADNKDIVKRFGGLRLRSEYKLADSAVAERDGGEGSINLTKTSSSSWMFQALSAQTRDRLQDLIASAESVSSFSSAISKYEFEEPVNSVSNDFEEVREFEQVSIDGERMLSSEILVEPKVKRRRKGRKQKKEAVSNDILSAADTEEESSEAAVQAEGFSHSSTRVAEQAKSFKARIELSDTVTDEALGDTEESRSRALGLTDSVVQESTSSEVSTTFEHSESSQAEPNLASDLGRAVYAAGVGELEVTERKKRRTHKRKARKSSQVDRGMVRGGPDVELSSEEQEVPSSSPPPRESEWQVSLSDGVIPDRGGGTDVVFEDKDVYKAGAPARAPVDEQVTPAKSRREKRRARRKLAGKTAKAGLLVRWSVQAQLKEGQRLFLSGSVRGLGKWHPPSAVPMVKVEGEDCWETQLEIKFGADVQYNYFVGSGDRSADIVWRPGALFAFQVPIEEGSSLEGLTLHDIWALNTPENVSSLLWGQWWDEVGATTVSKGPAKDTGSRKPARSEDLLRRSVPGRLEHSDGRTKMQTENKEVDVVLKQGQDGDTLSHTEPSPVVIDEWLKKKIRRKVLPREEPWLLESQFVADREEFLKSTDKKSNELQDHPGDVVEAKGEPEVQVEILINAPESTMQRMAILEDGKLVELLLEPVNSKVQVGNIYLGFVKQLLPGMVGVFVDIGSPRLALLDITRNIYPCTFPSITPLRSNGNAGPTRDEDMVGHSESMLVFEDEHDDEVVGEQVVDSDPVNGYDDDEEVLYEDQHITKGSEVEDADGLHVSPSSSGGARPVTVNFGRKFSKWRNLEEGMKIIVQVKKESMGKKGPRLTAYPNLAGRFWVVVPNTESVGISQKITGPERARLRAVARNLQPGNFGLTVRTEAMGHSEEELEKDLTRLFETWDDVMERAEAAASAAEGGEDDAVPVLLHRAMGQTLTLVRDFFTDKVQRMVVDSPQCYQEVTSYLAEVAPQLIDKVELFAGKQPIFDAFSIESEIDKFSSERVQLANGAYLVVQETEALVSIDVNGGIGMLNVSTSQKDAILEVNLAAARQIATELRLRDVGGIIVVDFIDMDDPKDEALVHEEMKKAIARDRSKVSISEISEFGVMEITRRRVRPSVTLMISDPCSCCRGAGRVEARETTISKIERAILRCVAERVQSGEVEDQKWPQVVLRVDTSMFEYLRSWKSKRITQLSSALKVWIILKVAMEFNRGQFQVVAAGSSKTHRATADPGTAGKKLWTKRRRYLEPKGLVNKKTVLSVKEAG